MKSYTYRVILEPDEGGYHAYVPALRGCHTWGKTIVAAQKNIREAMTLYLECMKDKRERIPQELGLESFETVALHA